MRRMLMVWAVVAAVVGDARAQGDDAQTRLLGAIRMGNTAEAARAIKDGADVNARADYMGTPLILALGFGETAMVRTLVEGGGNLRGAAWGEWSPLNLALNARSPSPELIKFLFEQGIKPEGDEATQALYLGTWGALRSAPVTQLLLDAGCSPRAAASEEWSVIAMAASRGTAAVVETLLKAGADANEHADGRATPLSLASGRQDVQGWRVVGALLAAKADHAVADSDGWTPITIAAASGTVETLRLLAQAGADVNLPAREGMTALHCAAAYSNAEMIRALLELGAKPNIRDDEDQGALELALRAADLDANLYEDYAPAVVLARVTRSRPIEKVRLLLEAGANVSNAGESGWTALMLAVYMWDVSRVGYHQRDDVERYQEWMRLDHELEAFAAAHDPVEMVRMLMEKGARRRPATVDGASELDIVSQRFDARRGALLELVRSIPEDPSLAPARSGSRPSATPTPRF